MPKTRQNKDRKDNLQNFKNQQKLKNKIMSENNMQTPPISPFGQLRQLPAWDTNAEFKLTGAEFMALQEFIGLFAQPVTVMRQIFERHLDSGTIQVQYQDGNGKEVLKADVENYLKELSEFMNTQKEVTTSNKQEKTSKPSRKLKDKETTIIPLGIQVEETADVEQ